MVPTEKKCYSRTIVTKINSQQQYLDFYIYRYNILDT